MKCALVSQENYLRYLWSLRTRNFQGRFSKIVEILFSQKRGFFQNFRDVSTYNTPKITLYCIFINKFPKKFRKKVNKKFSRRLRLPKRVEIPQFFRPPFCFGQHIPCRGVRSDPSIPNRQFSSQDGLF